MSTVADVARTALAAVGSQAGLVLCSQWVCERYRQFVRRSHLRHLRETKELYIPAPLTAGTVAATRGSILVTGDATAYAAWQDEADNIVGRHIRIGVVWHEVIAWNGSDELHLASEFSEDDVTAATYALVQRYTTMPSDVLHVGSTVHMRFRRELKRRTQEELNILDPSRQLIAGAPIYIAEAARALDGSRRIEIYPYSTLSETFHYVAWKIPPVLTYDDDIPSGINEEMLKEGTLIDVYRWEAAQLAKIGSVEGASVLLNAAARQYTQWQGRDIPEAVAEQMVMDDVQVILETAGGGRQGPTTDQITNARDQVWLR